MPIIAISASPTSTATAPSTQNSGCPDPTVLCFPNLNGTLSNLITTTGQTVPATGLLGTSVLGEIDRTWTTTNSFGGSAQAASSEKVFGHDNNFVVGLSVDRGAGAILDHQRTGNDQCQSVSVCAGLRPLHRPAVGRRGAGRVGRHRRSIPASTPPTRSTSRRGLSVTAGGRFNFAQINLQDELGNDPLLNGSHNYSHFNPIDRRDLQAHIESHVLRRYCEANRAPTPLELGCSDPLRPCLIDNALVGDPDLKQVVPTPSRPACAAISTSPKGS